MSPASLKQLIKGLKNALPMPFIRPLNRAEVLPRSSAGKVRLQIRVGAVQGSALQNAPGGGHLQPQSRINRFGVVLKFNSSLFVEFVHVYYCNIYMFLPITENSQQTYSH